MGRVEGPPVCAYITLITVYFEMFLAIVMAVLAQGLHLPMVEQPLITVMGHNVIAYGGWGDLASGLAQGTQGVFS